VAQVEDYPAYLDSLDVGEERSARKRIEELRSELETLTRALDESRRSKRMLFVNGPELSAEVVRFLTDELHLETHSGKDDIGDFHLADESGDWCIGDVRGSDSGNVTKEHLARLMIRRTQAGRGDDSPALLVVNTFAAGQTLPERDVAVPPDVARRAAEDHIVVTRTIDLVRLEQRAGNGFPAAESLVEALRTGGGWFEVDGALNAGLHRPDDGTLLQAPPAPSQDPFAA
jgi:hypothetical protein